MLCYSEPRPLPFRSSDTPAIFSLRLLWPADCRRLHRCPALLCWFQDAWGGDCLRQGCSSFPCLSMQERTKPPVTDLQKIGSDESACHKISDLKLCVTYHRLPQTSTLVADIRQHEFSGASLMVLDVWSHTIRRTRHVQPGGWMESHLRLFVCKDLEPDPGLSRSLHKKLRHVSS